MWRGVLIGWAIGAGGGAHAQVSTHAADVSPFAGLGHFTPSGVEDRPDFAGHVLTYDREGPDVTLEIDHLHYDEMRRWPVPWAAPGTDRLVYLHDVGLINLEEDALAVAELVFATAVSERPSRIVVENTVRRQAQLQALYAEVERFGDPRANPANSIVDTLGLTRRGPRDRDYFRDPGVVLGVEIHYDRRADFLRPDAELLTNHLGPGYPPGDLPGLGPFTSSVFADVAPHADRPRLAELVFTRGSLADLPPPLASALMHEVLVRAEARECGALLSRPLGRAPDGLGGYGFTRAVGGLWIAELRTRNVDLHMVALAKTLRSR